MPTGDAQRTWFPEMVVRLRAEWQAGMSMPALINLRDELAELRHGIGMQNFSAETRITNPAPTTAALENSDVV